MKMELNRLLVFQTIEMKEVISCNNDNCHARKVCSRPVSISWALLTRADCPPEVTRTLLCSVLVAHAPVDAPLSWDSQDGNIKRLLFSVCCFGYVIFGMLFWVCYFRYVVLGMLQG